LAVEGDALLSKGYLLSDFERVAGWLESGYLWYAIWKEDRAMDGGPGRVDIFVVAFAVTTAANAVVTE
jgi:hypothetical protein